MAKVTAKEIAAQLGISAAAVSLALNGKPGVSDETRALILDTCTKAGYPVSRAAAATSALSSRGKPRTLCFMIFADELLHIWENSTFYTFNMQGVEAAATTHGYNTLIRYVQMDTILSPANLDFLQTIDALILLGTDITARSARQLRAMLDTIPQTPRVVLDSMMLYDKADSLGNDNYGGAHQAVSYLAKKGCKQIAYLCSRSRISIFDEREAGVMDALREAGLPLFTRIESGIANDEAYTDILAWLQAGNPLPDGIFCENDVLAAAAARAMAACGISIPQQVSLIGFDNLPVTEQTNPPLTTIHSYKDDLGATAVNLLINRQQMGGYRHGHTHGFLKVQMSTKLIVRKSVRP